MLTSQCSSIYFRRDKWQLRQYHTDTPALLSVQDYLILHKKETPVTSNQSEAAITMMLAKVGQDTPITPQFFSAAEIEGSPRFILSDVGKETVQALAITHEDSIFWVLPLRDLALVMEMSKTGVKSSLLLHYKHNKFRSVINRKRQGAIELDDENRGWESLTVSPVLAECLHALYARALPHRDWNKHSGKIAGVYLWGELQPFLLSDHLRKVRRANTLGELFEAIQRRHTNTSRATTPAHMDPSSGDGFVQRPV